MVYRDFLFYLKKLGYGAEGRKLIAAAIREFLDWLRKRRINAETVKAYYEYLSQRPNKYHQGGLSSKTIASHLYALRLYFSYLEYRGLLASHPMSGMIFPKPDSQPREILSPKEIKQLQLAADMLPVLENITAKAVLAIFYGCGFRRKEGERLNLADVRLKEKVIYIRSGKGGKRRAVPMSQEVKETLKIYLSKARPYYGKTKQDPDCFLRNNYGGRMRGWSFDRILKKLLRLSGIEKQISLHCLRHSIATHLLHKGVPLESVRDFLGHQHLETTQIYARAEELPEIHVEIKSAKTKEDEK